MIVTGVVSVCPSTAFASKVLANQVRITCLKIRGSSHTPTRRPQVTTLWIDACFFGDIFAIEQLLYSGDRHLPGPTGAMTRLRGVMKP